MGKEDFAGLLKLAEFTGKKFSTGYVVYTGERVLSFKQEGIRLFALPFQSFYANGA